MSGESGTGCREALADIAYLTRSENRVRILESLSETSSTRRELEAETGIPRATVGRTLADFQERGWVRRDDGRVYSLTPAGRCVAASLTPFIERMAAIRKLGNMVAWLPTDEVAVDLRAFRDATIRRPERADPFAHVARATELLSAADSFRCLVGVAPPPEFEQVMRDRVVAGALTTCHVITAEELAYLRDQPDRVHRWREYVEGGANLYCFDGAIPCNLLVFDDTVLIGNVQSNPDQQSALLECDSEAVVEWTNRLIDRYRRKAAPLDAATFDSRSGMSEG